MEGEASCYEYFTTTQKYFPSEQSSPQGATDNSIRAQLASWDCGRGSVVGTRRHSLSQRPMTSALGPCCGALGSSCCYFPKKGHRAGGDTRPHCPATPGWVCQPHIPVATQTRCRDAKPAAGGGHFGRSCEISRHSTEGSLATYAPGDAPRGASSDPLSSGTEADGVSERNQGRRALTPVRRLGAFPGRSQNHVIAHLHVKKVRINLQLDHSG